MGTRLYVGNLPYDADEDSIKTFFEGGGSRQVKQVKIVTDRDTGLRCATNDLVVHVGEIHHLIDLPSCKPKHAS